MSLLSLPKSVVHRSLGLAKAPFDAALKVAGVKQPDRRAEAAAEQRQRAASLREEAEAERQRAAAKREAAEARAAKAAATKKRAAAKKARPPRRR